jgi:hypothetical protein
MKDKKNIQNFTEFNENLNISGVIQRNLLLSKSDVEYLQSVGFKQDNSKNSGLYYYEDDSKTKVIVPQEDGTYVLIVLVYILKMKT